VDKKAIIWGLATFAGLYVFHAVVIPFLVNISDRNIISGSLIWSLHQLLGLLICVIAGFISGYIAGDGGFKNGFIVGMLGTLLSAALASMMPVSPVSSYPLGVKVVSWLLVNGVITGLAGIFGVTVAVKKSGVRESQHEKNTDFRA
jgi:hypothetical protein